MNAVGPADPVAGGEPLQLQFDLLEGLGVEKRSQLGLTEQLTQQIPVQGQCSGLPFGQGCVVLVHVGGDEVEQQRGGEGTRGLGVGLGHPDLAGANRA